MPRIAAVLDGERLIRSAHGSLDEVNGGCGWFCGVSFSAAARLTSDGGILIGNGYSWTAQTCTSSAACTGGSGGLLGNGGGSYSSGNGGSAGWFGNGGAGGAGVSVPSGGSGARAVQAGCSWATAAAAAPEVVRPVPVDPAVTATATTQGCCRCGAPVGQGAGRRRFGWSKPETPVPQPEGREPRQYERRRRR